MNEQKAVQEEHKDKHVGKNPLSFRDFWKIFKYLHTFNQTPT